MRRMYAEQEDVFFYITRDERELRPPGDARGRGGGDPARACTCCARRTASEPQRAADGLRHDPARGRGGGRPARRATSDVDRRRLERDLVHRAPARRHGGRALEPAAPGREAAHRLRRGAARRPRRARSWPRPTTSARSPTPIRPYVRDRPVSVLGTDGYGRSDYRRKLRRFFEVDREHVVVAALRALGRRRGGAQKAIEQYGIDPEAEAPWLR